MCPGLQLKGMKRRVKTLLKAVRWQVRTSDASMSRVVSTIAGMATATDTFRLWKPSVRKRRRTVGTKPPCYQLARTTMVVMMMKT